MKTILSLCVKAIKLYSLRCALIIAVFNQSAYDNLVAQVKAAGFKLDMPGSEDIYTNGTCTIACYKDGKSIRIQ